MRTRRRADGSLRLTNARADIRAVTDQISLTTQPRSALVRQRALRTAWLCVAAGLIVPVVALWGVRVGWAWRSSGGQVPLIVCGLAVFIVRLALWMSGTT